MIVSAQIPFGGLLLEIRSSENLNLRNKVGTITVFKESWIPLNEEEAKKEDGKKKLLKTELAISDVNLKQLSRELRNCSVLLEILADE